MKRLYSLQRANEYVAGFRVPGLEIVPVVVTAQGDATSRLAKLTGDQVLIARPEIHQKGDADDFSSEVSLAFFVLAKDLGPAYTPALEDEAFKRLAEIASLILEQFSEDTTRCSLLAGLSTSSIDVTPESSLFGGWFGYSIDITMK